MDIFNNKKIQALEVKIKELQATEGEISNVILESLLTGTRLGTAGTENVYTTYSSQTNAIYKKYNGLDTLGNWQTRAVIDTRTGFIAGEGISVICKNEKIADFFDAFLTENKMYGSRFINYVKTAEMEGRELFYIRPDKEKKNIKLYRFLSNYGGGQEYEVKYADKNDPDSIKDILVKDKNGNQMPLKEDYIYIITGGDPSRHYGTTTRTGLVLHEIESFDRSKNAMRKNNHVFGKITPVFTSENPQDVANFRAMALNKSWKIGDVVAALKGNLRMEVPSIGAMDNLKAEQITCSKAIAATTGIPVHWFGHVDLMSNRSTAETLYETISNATILERAIWQEAIYDLLIMAQEMAIDNGILKGTVFKDFEIKIPLMSFSRMYQHVQALSLAFADDAISIQTYRNNLPGVNPLKEAKFMEDDPNLLSGLKNDKEAKDGTTKEKSGDGDNTE